MFVGETGVDRVVAAHRRADEAGPERRRRARRAASTLDTIQKYLNLWYALSLDLFGGEISSNAAAFFAAGLKGRAKEESYEDHQALERRLRDGRARRTARSTKQDVPLRNAMNEVLRDDYVEDCQRGVDQWNKRHRRRRASPIALRAAAPPLPPPQRHLRRACTSTPTGNPLIDGGVGAPQGRVAADAPPTAPTSRACMQRRSTSRARWPTGSRRRRRASTGSRSTSSTCAPSRAERPDGPAPRAVRGGLTATRAVLRFRAGRLAALRHP